MKVSGHLLRSGNDVYFRVYSKDGDFTDYDIACADMEIIIVDPFVCLTEDGKVDYTKEVLGG